MYKSKSSKASSNVGSTSETEIQSQLRQLDNFQKELSYLAQFKRMNFDKADTIFINIRLLQEKLGLKPAIHIYGCYLNILSKDIPPDLNKIREVFTSAQNVFDVLNPYIYNPVLQAYIRAGNIPCDEIDSFVKEMPRGCADDRTFWILLTHTVESESYIERVAQIEEMAVSAGLASDAFFRTKQNVLDKWGNSSVLSDFYQNNLTQSTDQIEYAPAVVYSYSPAAQSGSSSGYAPTAVYGYPPAGQSDYSSGYAPAAVYGYPSAGQSDYSSGYVPTAVYGYSSTAQPADYSSESISSSTEYDESSVSPCVDRSGRNSAELSRDSTDRTLQYYLNQKDANCRVKTLFNLKKETFSTAFYNAEIEKYINKNNTVKFLIFLQEAIERGRADITTFQLLLENAVNKKQFDNNDNDNPATNVVGIIKIALSINIKKEDLLQKLLQFLSKKTSEKEQLQRKVRACYLRLNDAYLLDLPSKKLFVNCLVNNCSITEQEATSYLEAARSSRRFMVAQKRGLSQQPSDYTNATGRNLN